ncbi:hypothetical protein LTS08_006330 [Lithohypha guttulata]|nr:hypothetical protein LTS08_006330 [Lithohypha guttulata]
MPKRKRDEEIQEGISQIPDQAIRIKASRLKARFDNGVKQLTAQLKLARGFDRQKMTRRIKQAESDKAKLERLQAEIQVLKDIDEAKVAKNYLLKQCVRTKRIAEAEAFRTLFGSDVEKRVQGAGNGAESNVLGRLFKSNPVSEVLPEIMKGIREVLGVDKPLETNGHTNGIAQSSRQDGATKVPDDEFSGFSDEAAPDEPQPVDRNGISGIANDAEGSDISGSDDMNIYDSRLAASSSDEDEEELKLNDMEITTDEEDHSAADDGDDNNNRPSLSPPAQQLKESHQPIKPPKSSQPPTSTSFLPSLMHGGYYSGSESDSDPDNPNKSLFDALSSATSTTAIRKNRRGQRARQQIAEKKYGASAKHLLKARGAEGVHGDRQRFISGAAGGTKRSDDGWDARRGAVGDRSRGGRKQEMFGARTQGDREQKNRSVPSGVRATTVKQTGGNGNEKLHPSWEAARKRKMETANVGASSFAGKKITFD